jgi:hypothetical protein
MPSNVKGCCHSLVTQQAWRDGTTPVVMAPLKFIQMRITGRCVAAKHVASSSAVGRPLPTADVGHPVPQLGESAFRRSDRAADRRWTTHSGR